MSLKQELEDFKNQFVSNVPEDNLKLMQSATEQLKLSGIIDGSCKKGDKAPDFSLPNVQGRTILSSDLLAKGPLVINFYRGGW
jgi:hypothetical protein